MNRIVKKTALASGNCNGGEGMSENGVNLHWEIVRECLKRCQKLTNWSNCYWRLVGIHFIKDCYCV